MKCPYLEGIYFQWCTAAARGTYVPTQFEFKEYCTNGGYKICPGYYNTTRESKDSVKDPDMERERLIANGNA